MTQRRVNRGGASDVDARGGDRAGQPSSASEGGISPPTRGKQRRAAQRLDGGSAAQAVAADLEAGVRSRAAAGAISLGLPRHLPHVTTWALIFALPYILVFALFVLYPIVYGFYLGGDRGSYERLLSDPIYVRTLQNTLLFVGLGVNLKLFLALLLSGFFFITNRWIGILFLLFILPWAVPSIPTILSFRWMLNSEWGMLNGLLTDLGIGGQPWLLRRHLGLAAAITVHIWKWLPFWTLILLAGRMSIPQDVYEAAAIDGATALRGFTYVTFPLIRNLYLTCTLLSTIWSLGDFNSIYLLTGGGPYDLTQVLATLSIRYAFVMSDIRTGVAVALTALPLIVPIVIYLVRRLGSGETA